MNIILKFLIAAIIISLSALLLTALRAINNHDLSMKKAAICNLKVKGPIYLISYADGEVYIANERVLAASALSNCVDVVYMYRKEHLDPEFIQKNKKILEKKRGAGYWLWKPYIILKTLNMLPEGSVVVYLDSGLKIMQPIDKFINNLEDSDIVVNNYTVRNKVYVKRDLLRLMNIDNEKVRNSWHLNAAIFAVKNTSNTRNFIKKWLAIAETPGAIDDSPSKEEYPEFIEHRHDQSIFSLLYLQNTNFIKLISEEEAMAGISHHRRRRMDRSLYVSKGYETMQMGILGKSLYELLKPVRKCLNKFWQEQA